jgi:hypothetical protein
MSEFHKWDTIRAAISEMVLEIGPRANFGAAVFPAPNSSPNSCTPGVEVAAVRPGDSPAGTFGETNNVLMTATFMPASGGTPTAATVLSLTDDLASLPGTTYAIVATDGGPNCDPDISCTIADCTLNIESSPPGCTPSGASNCCAPNMYGALNCLDGAATTQAIARLRARGVPTFVMGIPGSEPYATVLDDMAVAGGTARATKPYYYPVETTDQGAFYAALAKIAAKATGTCALPLSSPPKDPGLINVYFSEQVVPQAGPNGWTYDASGGGGGTVTLLGDSCRSVLEGSVLDVRIVEGCQTVEK